jgi:hypothetical protein
MQREILEQFKEARDALYGPPLFLCPAQNKLLLCFEVLKATESSTEDVLARGSFYNLEGFLSSNM